MKGSVAARVAAFLLVGGAALAACGGSAPGGVSTTAPTTAPTASVAATTAATSLAATATLAAAASPTASATGAASPAAASPTVVATRPASPSAGTPGTPGTPGAATSPVVFVRKFETSANPLRVPVSLAIDGAGNVYILDASLAPQIQKYDARGQFVTKWGGDGGADGQLHTRSAELGFVGGYLAIDRAGDIWVTDTYNYRVQHFAPDGTFVGKFGAQGAGPGQFGGPGPCVFDADGNLYVGDISGQVFKFDPGGALLATIGRPGTGEGQFSPWTTTRKTVAAVPTAIDRQGNLYVGDAGGARIQKFDRDGKFLLAWGTRGSGAGQFDTIYSLAIDQQGNVYVADGTTRIQQFDANGRFLGQWGDPGNGDRAFANPISAVAVDAQGLIYVLENNGSGPTPPVYVFRPR